MVSKGWVRDGRRILGAVMLGVVALSACGSPDSPPADAIRDAASKAPGGPPEVIDCSFRPPAVRPADLILACADLGIRVEHIEWKSWGPDRAEGDGVARENTCTPNCAAGNFVTKPVHVVLSDVVEPGHVFTKATTIDAEGKVLIRPLTRR
ncbi:hypothetical protein [Nocardia transvalensis]|uniref:hypothetical protein n=1 Tax=Nocardia transvalensis TaxID=37333 RepID=UPI00189536D4|nr:hypothetical protein [Nocardia transvalensis]MBF6331754.1 hypothetical protein [Nocardia transvalensis]